ncbi:MAG: NAD(P)H-hydrate dehydratase, partial [Alphaproteobacteria bacterium]|nr:NAD(P)H-hydrate dehydratase [Alphaproteobacteria bacterium]
MITVDGKVISGWFSPREQETHKGSYGRVLLIAGSKGMGGAALLSAKATLKSGAGLVYVNIPEEMFPIVQNGVWEAVLMDRGQSLTDLDSYQAIAIGPGLGMGTLEGEVIDRVFAGYTGPMVLDADGLNQIAQKEKISWIQNYPGPVIITPHMKEAQRLLAVEKEDMSQWSREEIAAKLVEATSAWVVLKGHGTLIMSPDGKVAINTTGNPGMATGGTGDVLTGII